MDDYEPELCQAGRELKNKWVGLLGKQPPILPDTIYIAIVHYFRHKRECRTCSHMVGVKVSLDDKGHWN